MIHGMHDMYVFHSAKFQKGTKCAKSPQNENGEGMKRNDNGLQVVKGLAAVPIELLLTSISIFMSGVISQNSASPFRLFPRAHIG